ncbi:myotubularin-related protein 6-like isoform X2 [Eriocheir sinensis]|uniref:myotubularin-related protein 6-like isoform X2 n=1 Tax=Eriocheir sinensis TaxID=95602 RepID=UPI0021C7878D|nr:myotubularin-related protein 6-like isoform X2 [Eriocheir sinensis]XP_050707864.1 myotubularin-related protein 6-like isoform X2 [Eriocheir sinensis]
MYRRIRSWVLDEHEEILFRSHPVMKKVENVRLLDRFSSKRSTGTLYLTATHLIFVDPDAKKETWILHMHISSVDKLPLSTQGSPLQVRCKTFLAVTFVIPKERDCHDIYTSLLQLSQPVHLEDLYCFHYTASSDDLDKRSGWDLYNPAAEYHRMGVPCETWTPTTLNHNYEICDTYPQELYVPASAPTKVILSSSKFRSKGRFPVLSYLHKNQAALCRSSQPLSGFSARCEEDEQLLDCILRSNPNTSHMIVVDTRPKINAMANRAAGKGYENEAYYENIKFHFSGIENIHVMRASLAKQIETCQLVPPSMNGFISGVESSGWLKHVRSVMDTAVFITAAMMEGVSVLVHCSDGWDRTAQTCALAQLLLDPYYRTIQGFQTLIEKEWLAFGHKFTDRCGHIQGDSKEVSPIFTQFIDCVWQLQQMLPSAFEFNERYLLVLHDHVFSCQFGTFIGNCQKDRVDLRLAERSYSLWGFIRNHVTEYRNPLYRRDSTTDVLRLTLSPQSVKFWRGMYNRFENGIHPREPMGDLLAATTEHTQSLNDQADYLTKRITWLKNELERRGRNAPKKAADALCDNRILDEAQQNEGKVESLGVLGMQEIEESLVSVGALTATHETDPDVTSDKIAPDANFINPSQLIPGSGKKLMNQLLSHQAVRSVSSELSSVSLDWKTFRNVKECSCSTPFDHFSRKHHCWRCGEVFCTRCIDKKTALPGHLSQQPVPVCRPCYKDVTRSLSVDTP